MIAKTIAELPDKYRCRKCGLEKPVGEMVLVRLRKQKVFLLRAVCKECNSARERGHRRDWKNRYLRAWRKRNPELVDSYWRKFNADHRAEINARQNLRVRKHHDALLIQGRLRRRLGRKCSLAEAQELLLKYGRCYPTKHGLTPKGLRECERICSAMRRTGQHMKPVEIRMMVYEDGYFTIPGRQPLPYQKAAKRLRRWHADRKRMVA